MLTTGSPQPKKQLPYERISNRQLITQGKARARRWAERKKIRNARGKNVTNRTEIEVPIGPIEPQVLRENPVLQDLLTIRDLLLRELSEVDIVIIMICCAYN